MLKLFMLLVSMFISLPSNGGSETTLTTATIRASTSAKPTVIYRRIYNESSNTIHSKNIIHNARRIKILGGPTLWDWDIWCQLQPKKGNCSENVLKYYYNADLDQCLTFEYTGCQGNLNKFHTQADCEGRCKGASLMMIRESAPITYCSLQVNAGYCLGLLRRYYYDVNEATCKEFTYGGCGGNQNNFETMRKCSRECQTNFE
ncbi:BPTI/Kunitz domain-containing protein isoform X1 [Bombyx mori]|uniref:BPTI/Kunitz inhibitor domain-containing protein n=1 Tax=Bombyx mori TaxID=7091 RepID=A0A8R2DLU9_BOMMO|nr:BPTI/Kunitz domain-containing protein-like isoform X1 [Bombyx mori]